MADGGYTILHRKDERGVIVESGVFGPDDEIPEGFGAEGYTPVHAPRVDEQEPVAESVLTPWESSVGKGTWVGETNEAVEQAAEDVEPVGEPEGDDELDEGSPLQAREQSEDGELTPAEKEAASLAADAESAVQAPPQGGPGSGKDVWAAYAARKGVEVPEDASRDEIIAACKAAGVPVD